MPKGHLFIVSGPAGSGKTTVCERAIGELPNVQRVVTATTRKPRHGETDKTDYYFLSRETFESEIAKGSFYEYAHVHNQLYGTLRSEVCNKLSGGTDLLLNIDVQGAAQMRKNATDDPLLQGHLTTIFIMPASIGALRKRLLQRASDAHDEIERRLIVAQGEMEQSIHYDYVIHSKTRDEDFAALAKIYKEAARK